jgi:hypothetical protein
MKDSFKRARSDLEEIYFYKLNQELIQKMKDKKDKSKSRGHLRLVSSQDEPEQSSEVTDTSDVPKKKAA